MLILKNVTAVQLHPASVREGVDIAIDKDAIVEVGDALTQRYPQAQWKEMHGRIVMPGLVDAHNHLGRWHTGSWRVDDVAALVELMDRSHVQTIVNLDGCWRDELETNLDRYDRAFPGRFVTYCRVDWDETTVAGWPDRIAASVADSTCTRTPVAAAVASET